MDGRWGWLIAREMSLTIRPKRLVGLMAIVAVLVLGFLWAIPTAIKESLGTLATEAELSGFFDRHLLLLLTPQTAGLMAPIAAALCARVTALDYSLGLWAWHRNHSSPAQATLAKILVCTFIGWGFVLSAAILLGGVLLAVGDLMVGSLSDILAYGAVNAGIVATWVAAGSLAGVVTRRPGIAVAGVLVAMLVAEPPIRVAIPITGAWILLAPSAVASAAAETRPLLSAAALALNAVVLTAVALLTASRRDLV